jgi:hypothetical protein
MKLCLFCSFVVSLHWHCSSFRNPTSELALTTWGTYPRRVRTRPSDRGTKMTFLECSGCRVGGRPSSVQVKVVCCGSLTAASSVVVCVAPRVTPASGSHFTLRTTTAPYNIYLVSCKTGSGTQAEFGPYREENTALHRYADQTVNAV